MLNGKRILVTGGTGSFGKKFIQMCIEKYPDIKRLVIFSRDELKQYEMKKQFSDVKYPFLRYFIGDVRDRERLSRAMEGIDIVIHAAALKQVDTAEYNPMECIKTNILGAENVIHAAMDTGVSKVIALSTDKAAAPINLYGATKLCSDKLFVAANNYKGKRDLKLSVVRYGNVLGSRGSVVPFFLKQKAKGVLPITHPDMTRFSISLREGVELVFFAIENAWGGEIFVPKIPSYRILDMAKAIGENCKLDFVGVRPGEKIHGEMITPTDAMSTIEFDNYYVITPAIPLWNPSDLMKAFNGKKVDVQFHYHSGNNEHFLTVDELRFQIKSELIEMKKETVDVDNDFLNELSE